MRLWAHSHEKDVFEHRTIMAYGGCLAAAMRCSILVRPPVLG